MNTTQLSLLLNHPNTISKEHIEILENVLKEYPYFQSARSLHLKALQKENNFKYTTALKLTAVHTTDRSILHHFIHDAHFGIDFSATQNTPEKQQEDSIIQSIETENKKTTPPENNTTELHQEPIKNPVDKLEKSVLSSIQFANNTTPDTPNITIETHPENSVLEQSVRHSIAFANKNNTEQDKQNTTLLTNHYTASSTASELQQPTEYYKEKTSWLEDSIDNEESIEPRTIVEILTPENNKNLNEIRETTNTFNQWLKAAKIIPIQRETTETTETTFSIDKQTITEKHNTPVTNEKMELIDKFIENNPKIAPVKDNIPAPSYISKKSDSPYLMTETLAKIYLEQKKYTKAIQAYEILILKYPEKSSLFADRILDIKDLQQNNNR